MRNTYLGTIQLVERMHRHCLELVKAELDRLGIRDLNNVQALILFNIGREELTVGELTQRGYYLGSNVSYNVKKLVENGYLLQKRSPHDRRSFHLRASDKGREVSHHVAELFARQARGMEDNGLSREQLTASNETLGQVLRLLASLPVDTSRFFPAA